MFEIRSSCFSNIHDSWDHVECTERTLNNLRGNKNEVDEKQKEKIIVSGTDDQLTAGISLLIKGKRLT